MTRKVTPEGKARVNASAKVSSLCVSILRGIKYLYGKNNYLDR